jgi:hypothetical protein
MSVVTGVAVGLLGAGVAAFEFTPLFRRLAGWPRLAARFGPAPALPYSKVGNATLAWHIGAPALLLACANGLIVMPAFTFWRSPHPVLVPWASVPERPVRSGLFKVQFPIAGTAGVSLWLNRHVAKRLQAVRPGAGAA